MGLMGVMDKAVVMQQVFPGSLALAGLVLVFLGGIYTAFDAYDAQQKNAVRHKYGCRAWLACVGFFAALASAALALAYLIGLSNDGILWSSIGTLAAASTVLVVVVIMSNLDI